MIEAMPAWDAQVDPELLLSVPRGLREVMATARPRPFAAVEEMRDRAELWHWRSRTRRLQEEATPLPPGTPGLDQVVRTAAVLAGADGMFQPIDEDFPAFGRAYRDASEQEWSILTSIAMERHRALNWLCGKAARNAWDRTRTDT